ncbi:MAG: hypothetical protein K2Y37_02415 [Pirellulales bacterium]|nr:hypothetical protein [Pirellulales bacterium]
MTRIFAFLALFAVLFVGATALLGLSLSDIRNPQNLEAQRWATVHRLSGVAAALAVMFVNGIAATYFIGTSRWCREVVDTYGLDATLWRASAALKRRTFPLSVANMLLAVAMVALGGAADPGASVQLQPVAGVTWAQIHLVAAFAGLAWFIYSSTLQWNNIQANREVIDAIMAEVRHVRAARGLD